MVLEYIQLKPGDGLPDINHLERFRCLIISELKVSKEWREKVCRWLVDSGIFYVMAWGVDLDDWHIGTDIAYLEHHNWQEPVDDEENYLMTESHYESLSDAMWYCRELAYHPFKDYRNTLILHISETGNKDQYLHMYKIAE